MYTPTRIWLSLNARRRGEDRLEPSTPKQTTTRGEGPAQAAQHDSPGGGTVKLRSREQGSLDAIRHNTRRSVGNQDQGLGGRQVGDPEGQAGPGRWPRVVQGEHTEHEFSVAVGASGHPPGHHPRFRAQAGEPGWGLRGQAGPGRWPRVVPG